MKNISFPSANEYALYYDTYLENVDRKVQLLPTLKHSAKEIVALYKTFPKAAQLYSYGEGKWSRKDVLNHLIDVERVFQYRAMRFARKDTTPLPFFDENEYAVQANANKKSMTKLLKEYQTTRNATIAFFDTLPSDAMQSMGIASQFQMSVRACAWIIYAHERHHLHILETRYLS